MLRNCLIALAALALCADGSFAQKKKPADPTASGVVKSVDAAAGTLTLAGQKIKTGGEAPDQTLTLAKDAKLTIDGKEAKLADVKAGASASLTLTEDKKGATAVSVTGGTVLATVKSVDDKANTITIEGKKVKKGEAGPDQTLALAKDAKVVIDGEAKALADIKAGTAVLVSVTVDRKTALSVTVGGKKKPAGGKAGVGGTVKAVDAKDRVITLAGKKGAEGQKVTVAKDAKITIDGEEKTLADIKEGALVQLTLDADKNATAVTVGGKKKKTDK